jgi:hypothetical protein
VKEPDTLLAEIRRTFLNEPADTVGVRWVEDDGEAWYQRVAELDAAITEQLGAGGLLIAGVENFDLLVRKAFAKDVQGGSLREFLTRKHNRIMLLTASARGAFDRDYDRPLFKAFEEIALEPWSVNECVAFFRAQRAAARRPPLTEVQEAKAKAVATFIGGTPRLATLIGEALLEDDPVRAADLLDKLVDELTPYYKERIQALPTRSQALLDGLLRGGEKCSATELAHRVGAPSQPAIAAPWMNCGRIWSWLAKRRRIAPRCCCALLIACLPTITANAFSAMGRRPVRWRHWWTSLLSSIRRKRRDEKPRSSRHGGSRGRPL